MLVKALFGEALNNKKKLHS